MKGNSKGFTLIELIAVIALLGTIGIIAISSYSSFYTAIQQKNINNNIEIIKNSAIEYYNDTLETVFMVNDLLEDGYLKANENNSYYIDKEDYRCYLIHVNVVNKEINGKKFEKINITLGEKKVQNNGACNNDITRNDLDMKYENKYIKVAMPANSQLTLISNLGHYYHATTITATTFSKQIDISSTDSDYPIIFSATLIDDKNVIYTKSIQVK